METVKVACNIIVMFQCLVKTVVLFNVFVAVLRGDRKYCVYTATEK